MDNLKNKIKKDIPLLDNLDIKSSVIYNKYLNEKNNISFKVKNLKIAFMFTVIIFIFTIILLLSVNNKTYSLDNIIDKPYLNVMKIEMETDDLLLYLNDDNYINNIINNMDIKFQLYKEEITREDCLKIYTNNSEYYVYIDEGYILIDNGKEIYKSITNNNGNELINNFNLLSYDEMGIRSIEQIKYTLGPNGDYYIVSGVNNGHYEDEEIKIKEVYNNLPVRMIESYAFYCCSYLKSIYIPETIELIGEYAFSYCVLLENVYIENENVYLETNVFENCLLLKYIMFLRKD